MNKTEKEILNNRFNEYKKEGLLSIKFIFGRIKEDTTKQIIKDVNNVLDMIDNKKYIQICWGDVNKIKRNLKCHGHKVLN